MEAAISIFNGQLNSARHRSQGSPPNKDEYHEIAPFEEFKAAKFAEIFSKYQLKDWKEFYNDILNKCIKKNCLLVVYDNIKSNIIYEMEKIVRFLGFSMNETIKKCILSGSDGKIKRRYSQIT